MNHPVPTDAELEFMYFGLYKALRRYRFATITGWLIVALGLASLPLGWNTERTHGLIDIGLSALTVVAGLTLVYHSVSALESYVKIPYPLGTESAGGQSVVVSEIVELMKEIDAGGWREAYAAIRQLKEMEGRHSLPPLG